MTIATAEDRQLVGDIIGEAFREDPVSVWTLGTPRAIRATFSLLAERLYLPQGHCRVLDEQAATMWLWPNQRKALPLAAQLQLAATLRSGLSLRYLHRALIVDAAMTQRRPTEPHLYLFAVGVLPGARGRGLGGAIIRETLAVADTLGLPSYLENSNPRNSGLYQRLGFQALETFHAAPGCPPITTMLRPAASD